MVRPLAFIASILTLASSSAVAQPSVTPLVQPAQPADQPEVVTTSYRNEILIASGLGVGTFFAGAMAEGENGRDTEASDTLFTIGGLGMMFAPAAVHFAHGEYGRGAVSVVLRWAGGGLGMMGALAMYECDSSKDWFCELDALGPGLLVGVSVASLIDAFAMTDQTHYRPRRERVWTPVLSASPEGGRVGLAGTF